MTVQESFTLFTHFHRQSGVHSKEALAHLHLVHTPLQVHLMSSLHAFETSGMLIHFGIHVPLSLFQENCSGHGTDCCDRSLVVQISAWKIERCMDMLYRRATFQVKCN